MWNMHDFYWCGVKQESDCLHHGSDRVGLDADSKFTKQDRMRSKKKQSTHTSGLNPRNIDKSVSDIRIRIRFPFESNFWISVSGCKLTILPGIQPANRIVIISALHNHRHKGISNHVPLQKSKMRDIKIYGHFVLNPNITIKVGSLTHNTQQNWLMWPMS